MRKNLTNNSELFSKVTSPEPDKTTAILYQDFKILFGEILRSSDPIDFAGQKMGQSYVYVQALQKENPEFFAALTDTVMKNYSFELRINEKMTALPDDDPEVMRDKRKLHKPMKAISFEELCDSNKFSMRGRVRELMVSFRDAMNYAGFSLSDMDKQRVLDFIQNVDRLCAPVAVASLEHQPSRVPA